MSAHWAVTRSETGFGAATGTPLPRVRLGLLLTAMARRHPERLVLIDPADKPAWSGRPAITWTAAAATEIVERLARGIRAWRLPPGSRIGLCLPGSAEAALAFLAVEEAGHLPCLLPVAWSEDRLVAAVEAAAMSAILTQSRLGALALAERLCAVAARYFGLRYLAAFGPDVPDGVINLDGMVLEEGGAPGRQPRDGTTKSGTTKSGTHEAIEGGFVSFAAGDPERPVHRGGAALVTAAAAHLLAVRAGPGERILSLLAPHDLRGLVTGLAAALVSGASLETLPVFDGSAFAAALARDVPTHLAAPGFLEKNLAGRTLPDTLRSISFVHRAPARLPARSRAGSPGAVDCTAIVDVLAFDEHAVLSGRRGEGGDLALILGNPERLKLPGNLMAMRREPDGRIAFRGQACSHAPLTRGTPSPAPAETWRASAYAPVLYAGIALALLAHEENAASPAPQAET